MMYTVERDRLGTVTWYVKDNKGAVISAHRSEAQAIAAAAKWNKVSR